MAAPQLSVAFFLQMAVLLAACRLVGFLAKRLGQPQVVGEMIAGVLLGPSLLGFLWPAGQRLIFPPDSLKILFVGAQLGVGLYMFLVGVDFKTDLFRSRIRSAMAVSIAGMVAPFGLGALLALALRHVPGLFSERATPFEASLFLGAAMAITAFPMLARIIYERGITGTSLGALALAAGAIGDAAAWCALAVVIVSFQKTPDGAVHWGLAARAILGGLGYGIFVLTIGRKLLSRLGAAVEREGKLTHSLLALTLIFFCLGAWAMDVIGIHAVFGGFLLGVAMPRGRFARELQTKLEPFAVVFLLPMFFCYSGLNTRLDMVNNFSMLLLAMLVLLTAIVGKGGASWAAARLNGETNRTALAVGALMNARGLMELILLNIGLQNGVILPALFSIMVLMAIVTTLMASPMFEWVYGRHVRNTAELDSSEGVASVTAGVGPERIDS